MDLSLFLKLVDRCIDLFKRREFVNKAMYDEVIKPLHLEFENVATQYFAMFYKAYAVRSGNIEEVLKELKSRREAYLQARMKVTESAMTIMEYRGEGDHNLWRYCYYLLLFFSPQNIADDIDFEERKKAKKKLKKRKKREMDFEIYTNLGAFDYMGGCTGGSYLIQRLQLLKHKDNDIEKFIDESEVELAMLNRKYEMISSAHMKLRLKLALPM